MTALLGVIAGRGYPLSVLYPATAPIYRSLGWELAGGLYRAAVPAARWPRCCRRTAPAPPPPMALRRAGRTTRPR